MLGNDARGRAGLPKRRITWAWASRLSSLVGGMAVCLWLWAAGAPPAWAGPVTVVDDSDVNQATYEAVQRAIEATLDFFHEEYGLTLDHDVRLVITANKEAFVESLIRRGRHSRDAAIDRAGKSVGLSTRGTILEDLGRQESLVSKVFVAAHELTHQFQSQLSRQPNRVRWISEGMANGIAAKVVEQAHLGSVERFRRGWLQRVRSAAKRPHLAELRSAADWMAAENRYGGPLIYGLGSLAVLRLIEQRGDRALFTYFRNLRDMDFEQAFRETFDMDLSQFERRCEDWPAP